MRLKDLIVNSLKPYQHQLVDWSKDDFEIFFMGFGNLKIISPSGFEFQQTFFSNATDICLALDELGFEKLDYVERDFYWMIHSEPAIIHPRNRFGSTPDSESKVYRVNTDSLFHQAPNYANRGDHGHGGTSLGNPDNRGGKVGHH